MSFCHTPRPDGSVRGSSLGSASFVPSRLQTRMRSSVMSGRREQVSEAGQHRGDATAFADGDDHERNAGVAAEERGAVANAVRGAVDAEQHRRPGDSRVAQQVDHRLVGGPSVGAFLAADVDGQLGGFVLDLGQLDRGDPAGQHPGAFERDEAVERKRAQRGQRAIDSRRRVDGDADEREVLGQGEEAVRAVPVLGAEALARAHDETGVELVLGVDVHDPIGQETLADALALAEVGRQLHALRVHSAAPSRRPSHAAVTPRSRLTAKLRAPSRSSPSSPRRWLSSAQVLYVVKPPIRPGPELAVRVALQRHAE